MNSATQNIGNVVAILTAILSEQEDLAYEMILEGDAIELFSAITGILLGVLTNLSEVQGITLEDSLKNLGMLAFNSHE
jgi:hypothetical protein